MQLDELVLYGAGDRVRRVSFRAGELNVITGDSRTGKSSLINIIRFCLGGDSPHAPAGPIRDLVEWYGLVCHVGSTTLFIARPAPTGETTTAAALLVGVTDPPSKAALQPNTTTEALRDYLGGLIGLDENVSTPESWQTRLPLAATLVHALYYCFQGQGEIANPDILFHHQNREFQAQAIRDTLPYFLGATGSEELRLRQELTEARRELRRLRQRLSAAEAERDSGLGRAATLLSEAREIGLVDADTAPQTVAEAREVLQRIADTPADESSAVVTVGPEYERLQQERQQLLDEVRDLGDQITGLEEFARVDTSYGQELDEQHARLASIGLVPEGQVDDATCATCGQPLTGADGTSHAEVAEALRDAARRLDLAHRDRPRIERARAELVDRQREASARLRQATEALTALAATDERAASAREALNVDSYVRGRITSYLEGTEAVEDPQFDQLVAAVEAATGRVQDLEERLDPNEIRSRVTSTLALVSRDMTNIARDLQLEHADTGARIDLDRLTIVADTLTGPAYMDRGEIGSGMNWVGYHLAAYLALHRYFVANARPVPRFIVLDQPSQAFFPPDREAGGDLDELSDTDRENTRRLYELVRRVVGELGGQLQVIALDHADFADDWFANAVVGRWRGGEALIPAEWLAQ